MRTMIQDIQEVLSYEFGRTRRRVWETLGAQIWANASDRQRGRQGVVITCTAELTAKTNQVIRDYARGHAESGRNWRPMAAELKRSARLSCSW